MAGKSLLDAVLRSSNDLVRPIDQIFRGRSAASQPAPLFIVGVPRSGTTLTYQLVTRHFRVAFLTDFHGYFYGLANLQTRLLRPFLDRPKARFESSLGKIAGLLSPSENARFWLRCFPVDDRLGHYVDPSSIDPERYSPLVRDLSSLSAIMRRPYVFKCLYLSLAVGALAQILPAARFLVVGRDPMLVVQSMLLARQRRRQPQQWWSVKPPGFSEWLALPLWQQVTRQVYYTRRAMDRDLLAYASGRRREVSYEALCRDPRRVMDDLAAWLAPLGYEVYQDSSLPRAFPVSRSIKLPQDTLAAIQAEYASLAQQDAHEI